MVHGAAIQYVRRSRKGSRQTAAGQDDWTAGVRGGRGGPGGLSLPAMSEPEHRRRFVLKSTPAPRPRPSQAGPGPPILRWKVETAHVPQHNALSPGNGGEAGPKPRAEGPVGGG